MSAVRASYNSGVKNPKFKRGFYRDANGYVKLSMGLKRGKLVHRVVTEARIGRLLRRNEHVHHIDGDPGNNRASNLALMTAADHAALTRKEEYVRKTRQT